MNTIQNRNSIYTNRAYEKTHTKKTTDILAATINYSKDSSKYNLKFQDNSSIDVDKSLINGSVGDNIKVKIEEKNGTKTFISQVMESQKSLDELDMLQKSTGTKVTNDSYYTDFLNESGIEASAENIKTMRKIKDSINSIINSGGEVSLGKLLAMGIDIGNISLDALNRFVYEANNYNTAPIEDTEGFEQYIAQNPDAASDKKMLAVIKALFEQGIPVNDNNISQLYTVMDNTDNITSLSDNEIIEFLKYNNPINFENIYKAKYSNSKENVSKIDEKVWNELKKQVENIFEKNGIELTEEHFDTAKMFIENEIPITGENIKKADFLKNPQLNIEYALQAAAKSIAMNKNALEADIFNYSQNNFDDDVNYYKETLKYINQADEFSIQNVIDENKEINLKNIIDEVKNTTNYDKTEISQEAITAKRQLLEIQMKLTAEAAARLGQKGIDINIRPLKEAINQLKEIEKELYSERLQNAGADVNTQSLDIMTQSVNKINIFPMLLAERSIYSTVLGKTEPPTINEIFSNRIFSTIDTLATAPNAKYGDSFNMVKEQLENVLSENNIEPTEENLRAAEILSRNNIDITEENILKVKITDAKINFIYDKLHPMTVANMIREGINPLETDIDEIVNYIKLYSDEYEQENREKIAEYILEADEKEGLTPAERTAVASVYRALSFVSRKNSKDVGAAVFADSSSTIGDILAIAKAVQKTKKGIDKSIDDNSEIKIDSASAESIKTTVENAIEQSSTALEELKAEYTSLLKDRIVELLAPSQLIEFIRGNKNSIDKTTLEELYYGLEKISNSNDDTFIPKEKIKALAEEIQNMEKGGEDIVAWLNENNIPLTLNNISNAAKLLNDAFKNGKELNKLKEELEENAITLEDTFGYDDIYTSVENAFNEIENAEDEIYNTSDLTKINLILKQTSAIKNSLRFQQNINDNSDSIYQIPIRLKNNTITNLNMFVLNPSGNNSDEFKGFINLETDNLGIIQGYLSVKNNSVSVKITADKAENEEFLKSLSSSLYSLLEKAGFDSAEVLFGVERTFNIFNNDDIRDIENNFDESFENDFLV